MHTPRCSSSGLTLVELLVVIAIIGTLMALILPAVQMARESSRRSSCANNLKQLATSVLLYEQAHGIMPTGGWGPDWVGDPDAGFTPKQPGGWIYNILPYVEQQALRDIGKGQPAEAKQTSLIKLLETPLGICQCPSRRLPRAYPYKGPAELKNVKPPEKVAKSDYAISPTVSSEQSEVLLSNIVLRRGASNTVMAGEKGLSADNYTTGIAPGDQLSMYCGDSKDVRRTVGNSATGDHSGGGAGFGGPHPGGCNYVYCDASVKFVDDDVLPEAPIPTD